MGNLTFVLGDNLICPSCSAELSKTVEEYVGDDDGIETACSECGTTITLTKQDDDEFSACTSSSDDEDEIDDMDDLMDTDEIEGIDDTEE